jgi:hypothetical protein
MFYYIVALFMLNECKLTLFWRIDMTLTLNDAKALNNEEKKTEAIRLYKIARKAYSLEKKGTAFKLFEDFLVINEKNARDYIKDLDLLDFDIVCNKKTIKKGKSMKLCDLGLNKEIVKEARRKVVYNVFEGKMYGKNKMECLIDIVMAHGTNCEGLTRKQHYKHVWNMILEDKGRKNEEGNEIGRYIAFNDKKELICTTKDKRQKDRIAYSDFNW